MGKYDQLFVRTPRPAHLTHYKLPQDIRRSIAWMDSSVAEGACSFECIWYYKPMEGPPAHVHEDSCEILGYFGSDPHDPYNLNGEIIYTIDGEEYSITESTLIFLPKGLPHSPYRVVRVDKPIFHFAVLPERHFSQLMKVPEPDHKP